VLLVVHELTCHYLRGPNPRKVRKKPSPSTGGSAKIAAPNTKADSAVGSTGQDRAEDLPFQGVASMSHRSGPWAAVAALLALTLSAGAAGPPAGMPGSAEAKALDLKVFTTLRDVINRGADLYNRGEWSACYRIYEGSLMTLRPLIDHRPELQKAITAGLASAERDPLLWRRAFTLRNVIDKIRTEVGPKKVVKMLPVPPSEDEKTDEKEAVRKVPVKKKSDKQPDETLPRPKPDDEKSDDKKSDEKKSGEKKDD
jgi:hypothetical protein